MTVDDRGGKFSGYKLAGEEGVGHGEVVLYQAREREFLVFSGRIFNFKGPSLIFISVN